MQARPSRQAAVLVVFSIIALAVASLWRLWEQDIWWQIRAGRDLAASWRFPVADEWSYSARGGEWLNIQWLSTLILHGVHRLAGVTGLILLRGLLAGLLALFVARVAWRGSGRAGVALALMPVVWLACAYRLQVRSDTFVLVVFAVLIDVATGPAPARTRRAAGVAAVLLAANLHAGTAPFVTGAAVAFLLADWRGWRQDLGWLIATAGAFLVTPYHVEVLPVLWRHVWYASANLIENPDHRQLSWRRFDARLHGFTAWAWLALVTAATVVGTFAPRLAQAWRRRPWALLVLLGLAAMSIDRDRVVPYAALFAVPAVAALLAKLARPGLVAALCWLFVPVQLLVFPARWGFGEDDRIDPVGAVAWINQQHPHGQILHLMGEGNYLLGHTEYPVFVDTRESMYRDLQRTYVDMVNVPETMAQVIARYDVRTVLFPRSFFQLPFRGQPRRASFFPKRDWALVYFDPGWIVLVRRTPEHAAMIAREEFVFLVPYLAPDVYPELPGRTAETDAQYSAELTRCLSRQPTSAFCRAAERVWHGE